MIDYIPMLDDRVEDKERVRVNISKTSYLTILFAIEGIIKSEVSNLGVQGNYSEADKVMEVIQELSISLSEYAVAHKEVG